MGDKDLERIEKELNALSPAQRERDFHRRAFSFAITLIVVIGIWGLTGAGYFWPGWVMLFGGVDLARRAWTTWAQPGPDNEE